MNHLTSQKISFEKKNNYSIRDYHFSQKGFTDSVWKIDQLLKKKQLTLLQAEIHINLKWAFK